MLLKDLYLLYEMIELKQSIGDGVDTPVKRHELLDEVDAYRRYLYYHVHKKDCIYMCISLGVDGHTAIFDHFRDDLKKVVCYQWRDPEKVPIKEEEVWDDTSDEESILLYYE